MDRVKGVAAVVGTFDGVHIGHRFLIDKLTSIARERCLTTRVYTFTDHPLVTLAPDRAPAMLNSLIEKTERLKEAGINDVKVLPFAGIRDLTARQFIERVAKEGVQLLLVGHDNRFGSDGLHTVEDFVKAADGLDVEMHQAPELTDDLGRAVNSTRARQFLENGDIGSAIGILGYHYMLSGKVVEGHHLGRTIGFPTANVAPYDNERKVIPGNGVYICEATVLGKTYPAMVNVGSRPTVNNDREAISIEAHIIGMDEDIYGKEVSLTFLTRLRDEMRFGDLSTLRQQLECDRKATLETYKKLRAN